MTLVVIYIEAYMSQTLQTRPIQASSYIAYFVFGATVLTMALFQPVWLSTFTQKLAWAPRSITPTVQPPSSNGSAAAISMVNQPDQSGRALSCKQWSGLSQEQVAGAHSLLEDNPLASNLTFTESPGKFSIAVISPAKDSQKQILAKKLNDLKIDTSAFITLPNGNKAWLIGTAKDQAMAQSIKADFAAKGVWNLSVDSKPTTHTAQFNTSSAEFINKLNLFSQERGIPGLHNCSN